MVGYGGGVATRSLDAFADGWLWHTMSQWVAATGAAP